MPTVHRPGIFGGLRRAIDLRDPPPALRAQPLVIQTAFELNSHPALNLDGDPYTFTVEELQAALHNPYVTPDAKARLGWMSQFYELDPVGVGRSRADPKLPAERAKVRELLASRGAEVFSDPYPDELEVPTKVRELGLRLPFEPGTKVTIQQGNNTMASPASHAPNGLRYALDFIRPDGQDSTGLVCTAPAGGIAYVYENARVNQPDNWGFGRIILIDHGNGYGSLLAHMDELFVKTGEKVAAGQRVGTVGTTGSAGNAHLHFQIVPMLRTPDPAGEQQRRSFDDPYAPAPDAPFGGTVPFVIEAFDPSAPGGARAMHSGEFQGGEAGSLMEYARSYVAP